MRTIEQILSKVPNKRENKDTTSHEFKKDLYDFFWEDKWRKLSVLEVIVQYMKEELRLTLKEISNLLKRKYGTIWTIYARTKN